MLGRAALLAAFTTAVLTTGTYAQPFGIAEGTPRARLQVKEGVSDTRLIVQAPRTHPEFENVAVEQTPNTGVCYVFGLGVTHANDRYGEKVRDALQELRAQLDSTYGASRLNEFLLPGALWREASEWTMAVHKNERHYQLVWGQPDGPVLANGVVEVLASVRGLSSDRSWIFLQFRYSNHKKCEQERNQERSRAF